MSNPGAGPGNPNANPFTAGPSAAPRQSAPPSSPLGNAPGAGATGTGVAPRALGNSPNQTPGSAFPAAQGGAYRPPMNPVPFDQTLPAPPPVAFDPTAKLGSPANQQSYAPGPMQVPPQFAGKVPPGGFGGGAPLGIDYAMGGGPAQQFGGGGMGNVWTPQDQARRDQGNRWLQNIREGGGGGPAPIGGGFNLGGGEQGMVGGNMGGAYRGGLQPGGFAQDEQRQRPPNRPRGAYTPAQNPTADGLAPGTIRDEAATPPATGAPATGDQQPEQQKKPWPGWGRQGWGQQGPGWGRGGFGGQRGGGYYQPQQGGGYGGQQPQGYGPQQPDYGRQGYGVQRGIGMVPQRPYQQPAQAQVVPMNAAPINQYQLPPQQIKPMGATPVQAPVSMAPINQFQAY